MSEISNLITSMNRTMTANQNAAVSAQKANNQFNAQQALLDRQFQERMSSTAHQREVKDLLAAGLNPLLTNGGNGSSTPTGAQAHADEGLTQVFGQMATSALKATSDLASVIHQMETSERNARIAAQAAIQSANTQAAATRYAANAAASASRYASNVSAANNVRSNQTSERNATTSAGGKFGFILNNLANAFGVSNTDLLRTVPGALGMIDLGNISNTQLRNYLKQINAQTAKAAYTTAKAFAATRKKR